MDNLHSKTVRWVEKVQHRKQGRDAVEERLRLQQLGQHGIESTAENQFLEKTHRNSRPKRFQEDFIERLVGIFHHIPTLSHVARAENEETGSPRDETDQQMAPPSRVGVQVYEFLHRTTFFLSCIEPAHRRENHDEPAKKDCPVEVTGELGPVHRTVDVVEQGALEPSFRDDVFPANIEKRR